MVNYKKQMRKEDFMVTLSYYTSGFFLDFPGLYILLEGFLILFGLVFLSVLGYYLFVFSARDDRAEKRMERYSNPWEKVSGQTDAPLTKDTGRRTTKSVLLAVMAVLAVLIICLLIILFGA
jgi:hypothetical protein